VLWEIGTDGNIIRQVPFKNAEGSTVQTNAVAAKDDCAIASDTSGNLMTIGVFGDQKKGRSIARISANNKREPVVLTSSQIDNLSIKKLIPFKNNTFIFVGSEKGNNLRLLTDHEGKILNKKQEKLFDVGQHESFTDAALMRSNNSNLAVVGRGLANITREMTFEQPAENYIVIYGPNDEILFGDSFAGGSSILLPPKVCYLDNGNIVVLYAKKNANLKTEFWARCYSQELKLLWEKLVFVADKLPFFFNITSRNQAGFVVGLSPQMLEGLEFYFFDKNGTQVDNAHYKGMVSASGFNLMRINEKIIAVFEEGSSGSAKDLIIKTKVIAFN
jgi:hypothetical protein